MPHFICAAGELAVSNIPQTATTPQAEACGVASAFPRLIAPEAGLAPLGLPCCSVASPAASIIPQTATTPQADACGVASAFPRPIAPEAGLAPSGSPAALSRLPPHLTYRRQRQPRRPKPAGLPLYAANAAVSIFCWDAGELRRGQITPTALPSSRQTAS